MQTPPDPHDDSLRSWLDRSVGSAPTAAQSLRLVGALVVTLVTASLIVISTRLTLSRIDEFVLVEWLYLPIPGVIGWRYLGYWYEAADTSSFTFRNAINRIGIMCCVALAMFAAWFLLISVILPFSHIANVIIAAFAVYRITPMVLPQTMESPVPAWIPIPGESLMQRKRPPAYGNNNSSPAQSPSGVKLTNATSNTVSRIAQDQKRSVLRVPQLPRSKPPNQ